MPVNVLLIHGNGGANARFEPFLRLLQDRQPDWRVHLPLLPGFEGRPLGPASDDGWAPFLNTLADLVGQVGNQGPWVFYGHGIGGSLLLEWAARGWQTGGKSVDPPALVVLHSIIGASLEHRFFPKLMRPRWVRAILQELVGWLPLQPLWERRLFLHPEAVAAEVKDRFFAGYRSCAAFPLFFDLITPAWYREVHRKTHRQPFHFLWGDRERVVASRYLTYWQRDFPEAVFEIVPGWDHFPMLEEPAAFYDRLAHLIESRLP